MKLANKVAVITGGSSGIGYAIAEQFIAEGAKVVIFGRNQQKLNTALAKLGNNAIGVAGDVTNINDLDKLFQTANNNFGKVDILVANAGVAKNFKIEEATETDFNNMFDINVKGTYFTVQRALPYLNSPASIILIASVAGHIGRPAISIYAASKAAMISMAKSFAAELLDKNIRVNSLSPGYTDTPFFDVLNVSKEDLNKFATAVLPMKRMAAPKEIATGALFLASDDSSYMTGNDLLIDGGRMNVRLA